MLNIKEMTEQQAIRLSMSFWHDIWWNSRALKSDYIRYKKDKVFYYSCDSFCCEYYPGFSIWKENGGTGDYCSDCCDCERYKKDCNMCGDCPMNCFIKGSPWKRWVAAPTTEKKEYAREIYNILQTYYFKKWGWCG
jgi:hypothetical protein